MRNWIKNYKDNFLKQVELDRQTDYKKKFKKRVWRDLNFFWQFINIFRYFRSWRRGLGAVIIGAFFPYLIIFWCLICIYEALFIYIFMLCDVIIFIGCKNWLKFHIFYVILRKFVFLVGYDPFFFFFPKFLQWLNYIFSFKFLFTQIGRIVAFFFRIVMVFYVPLLKAIAWLDDFEANYSNLKSEWRTKKQLNL